MTTFAPLHSQRISDLQKSSDRQAEHGFTLIELSLVLVIIGLIAAAILGGQTLVQAARVRGVLSQIQGYTQATNGFIAKYNGLPGDIPNTSAMGFGFSYVTGGAVGAQGVGDGNNIIEDGACAAAGGANGNKFCGEIAMFWQHLSAAGVLPTTLNGIIPAANAATGAFGPATQAIANPLTAMPSINFTGSQAVPVTIASWGGSNYFTILPITSLAAGGVYVQNSGNNASGTYVAANTNIGLSPALAEVLDAKIDDGLPTTGNVLAVGTQGNPIGGAAVSPVPVNGATACTNAVGGTTVYNGIAITGAAGVTNSNSGICGLAINLIH